MGLVDSSRVEDDDGLGWNVTIASILPCHCVSNLFNILHPVNDLPKDRVTSTHIIEITVIFYVDKELARRAVTFVCVFKATELRLHRPL